MATWHARIWWMRSSSSSPRLGISSFAMRVSSIQLMLEPPIGKVPSIAACVFRNSGSCDCFGVLNCGLWTCSALEVWPRHLPGSTVWIFRLTSAPPTDSANHGHAKGVLPTLPISAFGTHPKSICLASNLQRARAYFLALVLVLMFDPFALFG